MIRRTPERDRYLVISKIPLEDKRLSWKARGLHAYLMSKPDNWNVMIEHLISQAPDGRASVRAGLIELRECGYIVSSKSRGAKGAFDGWDTIVLEEPDTEVRLSNVGVAEVRLSEVRLSDVGKSNTNEERTLMKTEFNEFRSKSSKDARIDEWFEQIWEMYPRKEAKKSARSACIARVKSGVKVSDLILATKNYAKVREGEDEKFTMLPTTFFGTNLRYEKYLTSKSSREEEVIANRERERSRELQERREREHASSVPMPESMKFLKKSMRGNL